MTQRVGQQTIVLASIATSLTDYDFGTGVQSYRDVAVLLDPTLYTGTVDIQGRITDSADWQNVRYAVDTGDGALSVVNDQIALSNTSTSSVYRVSGFWPRMRVRVQRTSGTGSLTVTWIAIAASAAGDVGGAAAGGGSGSGASVAGSDAQVQFNDGGSFGADAGFTYNKTTDVLTLVGGVVTPLISTSATNTNLILAPNGSGFLDFQTAGLATTGRVGLALGNTTAATAGAPVQYSPRLHFTSQAWNTTATAANNYLEAIEELRPSSATTPVGTLAWALRRSTNQTGAFTDAMTLAMTPAAATTFSIGDPGANSTVSFVAAGSSNFNLLVGGASRLVIPWTGAAAQISVGLNPTTDIGAAALLGGAATRWKQFFVGPTGIKLGDGTNGPTITATGTSPNESLILTTGGTGNVGIGVTSPTAVLHLKAGTATAGTAPLKLTSGTLLTTPEAGAVEYLSGQFYVRGTDGLSVSGNVGIGRTAEAAYHLSIGAQAAIYESGGILRFKYGNTSTDLKFDASGGLYPNTDNYSALGGLANRWTSLSVGTGVASFAGTVGIGVTGPSARLHLAAGSATAGTAPFKATSGTLLTTPEAGTLEYLSAVFYLRGTDSLSIAAKLLLANTTSSALGGIYFGGNRAFHNYGTNNTFVGVNSGNFTLSGSNNTALGYQALLANSTGTTNVAIGVGALQANTAGGQNTAVGYEVLKANTIGAQNTAYGYQAMLSHTEGSYNTGIGQWALLSVTTGTNNTALGYAALYTNTASGNTAVGSAALAANTSGAGNTAVGTSALQANTTGALNTAFGYNALFTTQTGEANTALGHNALYYNTIGASNTAVGVNALYHNISGAFDTAVGVLALEANTTGSYNTALGVNALKLNISGPYNTGLGFTALTANTNGENNTGVGAVALQSNTTGDNNTALGYQSLAANTTGNSSTAVGAGALRATTSGAYNTALGFEALAINTEGDNNTASGTHALYNNTIGDNNTATGYEALKANTSADSNTAFGAYALTANITGASNSAFGTSALLSNLTGTANIAIGLQALAGNLSGSYNTATGVSALYGNTDGTYNTANGIFALQNNSTGDHNTATGANALSASTTSDNNSAFGSNALRLNTTGASNVAVGKEALYTNVAGNANVGLGAGALYTNLADNNTAVGALALFTNSSGASNVALGYSAGKYETGSNAFYVDNQDRTNTTGDKAGALLYGIFSATVANQTLTVNAKLIAANTVRLKGYTVAALPAGTLGDTAFVTDQLTTAAAKNVAPTGGGAVNCVVFYNGAAWVGI